LSNLKKVLVCLFNALIRRKSIFSQHITAEANMLIAYCCYGEQCETIMPVDFEQSNQLEILPLSDSIFQTPGFVRVEDSVYDLRKDGLYRFYKLPSVSEQRIVCSSGLKGLFNFLGYLWAYGLEDIGKTAEDNEKNISKKVLMFGCNDCSFLAVKILTSLGIKARVVAAYTQNPWGGQDDGHTLVEVFSDGTLKECEEKKWILYDPSFNKLFFVNNTLLSLKEMIDMQNCQETMIISLPGNSGHPYWRANNYDYGFWVDHRIFDNNALRKWYKNTLNIGLIYDSGFFFNEDSVALHLLPIFSKCYKPLAEKEFNNKFYPNLSS